MEEKMHCEIHSNEYFENYCEECKELICPHCALSQKHFSHITKIKSLEEIIKLKIKGIDDFKNFSLYKTTELFQFIINYNSLFVPFDNSYIINSINDQFDKYIQKIIEMKFKIINLFSKKFELMSEILQSTRKTVIETQHKLLVKIGGNNDSNNEYLNNLNICLEKIRINKNPNEAMNFIGEYQNLINECFENNEDLNKKYNFYLAYKYLNDISFSFKDKFFDKLILPNFKNALSQIEELIKKLNIEEKKDYEDFKSKLKELNIETEINKEQNKIEKNKDNKEEIKLNKEKNIDKKVVNNNINDKKNEIIEPNNNKKENEKEKIKQKKERKEEIIKIEEKEKEKIEKNNNIINQKKDDKNKNNENIKKDNENEEKEKEKEKEEFKKMLDSKNKQKKNEKNDNCNIEFEPPKIEGGKMTQEEINNLKEDEEEKFLKKESETEDKEIASSLFDSKIVEKTELEIAKKIIDELDEDRLDIQYYEGIKFPEDEEKGGNLDNAYLEDNENKNEIKENESKENKESEAKENINKNENEKEKDEINDIKEEEKKEKKNNEKEIQDILNNNNKQNEVLNQLDGNKNISSNNNGEDKNNKANNNPKDKIEKEKPLIDLDQWVNIESEPKADNNKKDGKNKKKNVTNNPKSFSNVFGVKPEMQNQKKQNDEKEKEIIYKEPKLTAPNNLESIEKLRKLYNIINSGGRNNPEYKSLFNSLTWEEKNYIEIIGLKSSDSTAFVYNQISNKIENFDTKIKFPSHQSYINVLPYVYLSGGKDNNKPINLIRRLRKFNNFFKLEDLGTLKEARSHHSTIYVKSMNSLIFISGSKTKTCEKFNLAKNQIESFPSVKNSREKCGTCLENDEMLYIFFGFDKAKSKFETSVERINLNKSKSWEVLSIIGDQNLLKRQSMACIPFNMKNGKGIIITGGVGNLRNESDDTIYIDLEKNNVNKFNFLPFGASFTNPNFLPLTLGVEPKTIYNITNENKIISFNLENYSFSGNE